MWMFSRYKVYCVYHFFYLWNYWNNSNFDLVMTRQDKSDVELDSSDSFLDNLKETSYGSLIEAIGTHLLEKMNINIHKGMY